MLFCTVQTKKDCQFCHWQILTTLRLHLTHVCLRFLGLISKHPRIPIRNFLTALAKPFVSPVKEILSKTIKSSIGIKIKEARFGDFMLWRHC